MLSGSVPTYFEVALATDDTGAVGGVTAIDNQLLVGLVSDAITDAELATATADALDNYRFVPKGAVTADVLEGFVTLTVDAHRCSPRERGRWRGSLSSTRARHRRCSRA
jgi:osmotically-inducible protein OsmY